MKELVTVHIRLIKHKEDLLWNAINDLKIDITIVTETWLQDTNKDTIWVEGSQFNKDRLQINTCNQTKQERWRNSYHHLVKLQSQATQHNKFQQL